MTIHVGVDLAWGERQPTGVAVLDDDARLLAVAAVRTDDDVADALEPWLDPVGHPDLLVAVDAPLIVVNPDGSRPAERELSRDFRRFEAGAHPANTGKPEFAEGTRGARLAVRLGLPIADDPLGRGPDPERRRVLEVYPHPATVVLFGLDKTLKYKNKPGRDFESLQAELVRLIGFVADVVDVGSGAGAADWAALHAGVRDATRKSELRHAEDQVDAVVCAYVAWFVSHRPDDVTVYGEPATGTVVTPSLGVTPLVGPLADPVAGGAASRSAVPGRGAVVRRAVDSYAGRHPHLVDAGVEAVALVTSLLDEAGINYLSVTGRTKSVASFAEKATRTDAAGEPLFDDPLAEIGDTLGVRVITYVNADVDAVARLLRDQVVVLDDRDLGRETAREGRFGYASRHLQVRLDPGRAAGPDFPHLAERAVQVQVRTVLQHAWAEFEHDIRYKGAVPEEHAREFDRRFTLAAGLLELADQEFAIIRSRLRGVPVVPAGYDPLGLEPEDDPRIDPRELAAFLAGQYSDAEWSRADHYGWISGLLLELGVTSLGELGDVLRGADQVVIAERMDYRYPPGAVRRLDDALLLVFGERYVALHGNAHRRGALDARWEKLRETAD